VRNLARLAGLAFALASCSLLAPRPAAASAGAAVVALDLRGVVDPFTADYVRGGIASANADGAAAVLLQIDTPGGYDSSMRSIVQAIDASHVPVLCYVSPSGARAASAGTFILMSCHVAAMAPGTEVGAAHPVGVSGAIESEKVENDAVAFIRGQAELRGRNAAWAESAVRSSVSVPAEEALRLGVIELVAADRSELLRDVDGRRVRVAGGETVTLSTADAPVATDAMNPLAFGVHSLITPDFAFLFFVLGIVLLVVEVLHPGVSVPGILGGLLLVFSLVSFGMLPVDVAGLILLVAAVALFVVELKHPGLGLPAVGGVVFLSLGGVFLFDHAAPGLRVSPWLIATAAAVSLVFFGTVVRASLRARHLPPPAGPERLIGSDATVIQTLAPIGVIRVNSETWTAVTAHAPIAVGEPVRIIGVEGLKLRVEPRRAQREANRRTTREGSSA
jgi:membrane-bound serine protease (ClpP class)